MGIIDKLKEKAAAAQAKTALAFAEPYIPKIKAYVKGMEGILKEDEDYLAHMVLLMDNEFVLFVLPICYDRATGKIEARKPIKAGLIKDMVV